MDPTKSNSEPAAEPDTSDPEALADYLGIEPAAVEAARAEADALGRAVTLVYPGSGRWRIDCGEVAGPLRVARDGPELRLPIPSRLPAAE